MGLRTLLATTTLLIFVVFQSQAQCTGCIEVDCSATYPDGGICDTVLPDGQANVYYDEDVSFYMPPLIDYPGVGIVQLDRIQINGMSGLPVGLSWESSQSGNNDEYYPISGDTVGCVKFCGTPIIAGTYPITVFLLADVTVPVVGQVTNQAQTYETFLTILPDSGGANSFTLTPPVGCDTTTFTFTTNFPSGGNSGYSYSWDFGNGNTSTMENPPTQTYAPGTYDLVVTTIIDTTDYLLQYVNVTSIGCDDCLPGVGCLGLPQENPDIEIVVKENGNTVHSTGHGVDNSLPYFVPMSAAVGPLNNSTYSLEFSDEEIWPLPDQGCGSVTFNGHTVGMQTLTNGSLSVDIEVTHPVIIITDSIQLVVNGAAPSGDIMSSDDTICAGDSTDLMAPAADNYQWYRNGAAIPLANTQTYRAGQGGMYTVEMIMNNGCIGYTDSFKVSSFSSPPASVSVVEAGNQFVVSNFPGGNAFDAQWYFNGVPIPGGTGQFLDRMGDGSYFVVLFNKDNPECASISDTIIVTGIQKPSSSTGVFSITPNPNNGVMHVSFDDAPTGVFTILVQDLSGKTVYSEDIESTSQNVYSLDLDIASGTYFMVINTLTDSYLEKFIIE